MHARSSVMILILLMASVALAHAQPSPSSTSKVVDLGHPLTDADPTWTGKTLFTHTSTGKRGSQDFYSGSFQADEHFGTHLDAPAHLGGEWTVERIPVDRFVRPGFCLNVDAKVRGNDDYQVTLADVKAFEQANGPIPEGAVLLIATGWDRYWKEPARYRNERDGVKHFPGLSAEAAAYLANERRVAGIVIDTLSVDYGPSTTFDVHRTTHGRNIYHVENAARLTTLPPRGFTVVVAPINVAGASGGATRLYALLP